MKKTIPFLVLFIFTITSCNSFYQVEKRHYRKGFYFHRNNSETKTFSVDSVSNSSPEIYSEKKQDSFPAVKSSPVFQKIEVVSKKKFNFSKNKIQRLLTSKTPRKIIWENSHTKNEDGKNPWDRYVVTATVLGVAALILVVIGLLLIEVAVFSIVPLLIGLMCAFLGLRFGRSALYQSSKKHKEVMSDADTAERKKKVKRSYLLNLIAILVFFAYILLRFGIVAGGSSFGIALLLVAICLVLLLLFRMGVFRDLREMKK